MQLYINEIQKDLERKNIKDIDPRHILGYTLVTGRTLLNMSKSEWKMEIEIGVGCVREGGVEAAENLARSFGL